MSRGHHSSPLHCRGRGSEGRWRELRIEEGEEAKRIDETVKERPVGLG